MLGLSNSLLIAMSALAVSPTIVSAAPMEFPGEGNNWGYRNNVDYYGGGSSFSGSEHGGGGGGGGGGWNHQDEAHYDDTLMALSNFNMGTYASQQDAFGLPQHESPYGNHELRTGVWQQQPYQHQQPSEIEYDERAQLHGQGTSAAQMWNNNLYSQHSDAPIGQPGSQQQPRGEEVEEDPTMNSAAAVREFGWPQLYWALPVEEGGVGKGVAARARKVYRSYFPHLSALQVQIKLKDKCNIALATALASGDSARQSRAVDYLVKQKLPQGVSSAGYWLGSNNVWEVANKLQAETGYTMERIFQGFELGLNQEVAANLLSGRNFQAGMDAIVQAVRSQVVYEQQQGSH